MIKAYAEPKGHFVEVKLTNIEYQFYDYMMWFSEESIYRYHKVYNVFELEAKNEHKAV